MERRQREAIGLKMELRQRAESLNLADFRAISIGLGNGELRLCKSDRSEPVQVEFRTVKPFNPTVEAGPPLASVAPNFEPIQTFQVAGASVAAAIDPHFVAAPPPQKASRFADQRSARPFAKPAKILAAHGIDLLFSAVAVMVMLSISAMSIHSIGFIAALRTMRTWLSGLTPMELVAALYATFLLYAGVFLAFVGSTFGNQLLRDLPDTTGKATRSKAP